MLRSDCANDLRLRAFGVTLAVVDAVAVTVGAPAAPSPTGTVVGDVHTSAASIITL